MKTEYGIFIITNTGAIQHIDDLGMHFSERGAYREIESQIAETKADLKYIVLPVYTRQ